MAFRVCNPKHRRLLILALVVLGPCVLLQFIFFHEEFLNSLSSATISGFITPQHVAWDWLYYYSSDQQHNKSSLMNDTLVAQYTGTGGNYTMLLDITKTVNQAYAKRHGMDYLTVWGSILNSGLTGSATFNKPYIVEEAILRGYKYLFILDADALVVEMDRDFRDGAFVAPDRVFAGQKVEHDDANETHNINIGVTVWNLRHNKTIWLVNQWKRRLLNSPTLFSGSADDQYPLQRILYNALLDRSSPPLSLGVDFNGFVSHVMRSSVGKKDWTFKDPGVQDRAVILQNLVNQVCAKYACDA